MKKLLLICVSLIFINGILISKEKWEDKINKWVENFQELKASPYFEEIFNRNFSNLLLMDNWMGLTKDEIEKINNSSDKEIINFLEKKNIKKINLLDLTYKAHSLTNQEIANLIEFFKYQMEKERFIKDGYAKD